MKDIAESTNRSYGAIKERLKKIIYENIKNIDNNDDVQRVAKYLNLDSKLVKNYYRSYGGRIEQKQIEQKQIEQKQVEQKQIEQKQVEQKQVEQKQVEQKQVEQKQIEQKQVNRETNQELNQIQSGGTNMTIKRQNEMLEDIIKNHDLKKKVGKLVKTKQLDKDSKEVLKKLLLNIKN
jgi:hypothetical protein